MCHQPRCGWPCRPSQWGLSPNPQRAGSHKHPTPLPQPPSSPIPSWFPIFFPDVGTTGPMISLGTQAALPAPWGCAGAPGHWSWWLEILSGTRKIGKNSEFCFLRSRTSCLDSWAKCCFWVPRGAVPSPTGVPGKAAGVTRLEPAPLPSAEKKVLARAISKHQKKTLAIFA